MTLLTKFERHSKLYEFILIVFYLLINTTINATSILMEASRGGAKITFPVWQPFVWEYSSALSLLMLFPILIIYLNKVPLTWQCIKKNFIWHVLASFIFSIMHVFVMVVFRKIIYLSQGMHYRLGELPTEFFYEYRKDVWTYFSFIIIIYGYRFVISRMRGEAQPISCGEDSSQRQGSDRLLVKKLGKEFIINIDDIDWLESSGNYVNLHIKDRIYPIRTTLTQFAEQFAERGFARVHRSYGVNLNFVDSITPLSSGDCEIILKNGKSLSLSRRYKEAFKAHFSY